jgi:hypothetical protein
MIKILSYRNETPVPEDESRPRHVSAEYNPCVVKCQIEEKYFDCVLGAGMGLQLAFTPNDLTVHWGVKAKCTIFCIDGTPYRLHSDAKVDFFDIANNSVTEFHWFGSTLCLSNSLCALLFRPDGHVDYFEPPILDLLEISVIQEDYIEYSGAMRNGDFVTGMRASECVTAIAYTIRMREIESVDR